MELETKIPLLSNNNSNNNGDLLNPASFEDTFSLYNLYTANNPFNFQTLLSCHCLAERESLTASEAQAFQQTSLIIKQPFSLEKTEQKKMLLSIWFSLFRDKDPPLDINGSNLKDERWKEIGFQNNIPESDFRSGGSFALRNICSFVEEKKEVIEEILSQSDKNEFLFAVTSINVSFFLKKYFLMAEKQDYYNGVDVCTKKGFKCFCGMLQKDEDILLKLHHILLEDLYYSWLQAKLKDSNLNIMKFNLFFSEKKLIFHKKMSSTSDFDELFGIYEKKLLNLKEKLRK